MGILAPLSQMTFTSPNFDQKYVVIFSVEDPFKNIERAEKYARPSSWFWDTLQLRDLVHPLHSWGQINMPKLFVHF